MSYNRTFFTDLNDKLHYMGEELGSTHGFEKVRGPVELDIEAKDVVKNYSSTNVKIVGNDNYAYYYASDNSWKRYDLKITDISATDEAVILLSHDKI